jgi:hypothetical protein
MKRILLAATIAASLIGCAAPRVYIPTPIERPPFPEAEYAALAKTGTATVTGQAFLKTRGGDVKTAAGNGVYLNPVTSYSKFAYDHRNSYDGLTPTDPRFVTYLRQTVADGSGRFTFKNVPDGEYYLSSSVTWETPTGYKFAMETQGGTIWKVIRVERGESVDVVLTQ